MHKLRLSTVERKEIVDEIFKRLNHIKIKVNPRAISYLPDRVMMPLEFQETRNASVILSPYGGGRYKVDVCLDFDDENKDIVESLVSEDWEDLAPFVQSILKKLIIQGVISL